MDNDVLILLAIGVIAFMVLSPSQRVYQGPPRPSIGPGAAIGNAGPVATTTSGIQDARAGAEIGVGVATGIGNLVGGLVKSFGGSASVGVSGGRAGSSADGESVPTAEEEDFNANLQPASDSGESFSGDDGEAWA